MSQECDLHTLQLTCDEFDAITYLLTNYLNYNISDIFRNEEIQRLLESIDRKLWNEK
jgi:hypothetical protein